eukprot:TRINITY_DN15354_c0_g1_i1.p1 TRINITY_DN15354_c0_g1~~TRINITY_DN15354_c0_g1_i1.p1  ORF type:complete len:941 (+),score=279.73 TRINITY_DN15354_c0_g1_i1:98-2920(+)
MAAAVSDAEKKLRFFKFWQAVQVEDGKGAQEAAVVAMAKAQDNDLKTPDFYRGDVQAALVEKLDATKTADLENAVMAFRDPFLLNMSFMPPAATSRSSASSMDVDSEGGDSQKPDAKIPGVDVVRLKQWFETVENFVDKDGDATMGVDGGKASYSERILESFGDLASQLERAFCKRSHTGDKNDDLSKPYGVPTIPPSFLDSPRGLRFLLLILFHPSIGDPDTYGSWNRVLRAFRILRPQQQERLAEWMADDDNIDIEEFRSLVQNLQQYITITFLGEFASSDMPADAQENPGDIPSQVWDFFVMRCAQKCKNALCAIEVLWKANLKRIEALRHWRKQELTKGTAHTMKESGSKRPEALKADEFFNDALNGVEKVLQHEYAYSMYFEHLERDSRPELAATVLARPRKPTSIDEIEERSMLNDYTFGLICHSFCMDASNKCRFLMLDASHRQREETRAEMLTQIRAGNRQINPYLTIHVRRDNLVQDTLQTLRNKRPEEYRKKLKVVFQGEPGMDEGGVQKEFFQLLVEQLYDPNYAMFNYNANNKTYWFNPGSFESNIEFELFGALLGIAIYNQVILDIRFPAIVYQKLLAEDPSGLIHCSIDDLIEVQPELAKSLLGMLEFEGSVEDVYCRNFVASYEHFGAVVEVPLKEGGEHIPVTNQNCGEYVDLYIDWFFNKSIDEKFRSFKKGFLRCMEVEEKPEDKRPSQRGNPNDLFNMLLRSLGVPQDAESGAEAGSGGPPSSTGGEGSSQGAGAAASPTSGADEAAQAQSGQADAPAVSSTAPAPSATGRSGGAAEAPAGPKRKMNMFLQLFRASELELLICGNEVLDFTEYKNNCDYTDGYEASSQQCKWFWEIVLDNFTDDERKELLAFITGSDRAPPKGLGAPEARLTISRQSADSESLPTAHTCFNHLLLPEYSSKEKLEAKLKLSIKHNQGFGII